MTIDGFRPNRDSDGYKLPKKPKSSQVNFGSDNATLPTEPDEWSFSDDDSTVSWWNSPKLNKGPSDHPPIPKEVVAVPRPREDVRALLHLTEAKSPPWRRVRAKRSARIYYGFADASGSAFGGTLQEVKATDIVFEFGQWTERVTNEESSNWREFTNLVEFLEGKAETGMLDGAEVFMFTDNSTTEAAFWKGTSPYKKLCDLVIRLRKLEMSTGMILHVCHVSGRRMIDQGADGLSRGDHTTGVMAGDHTLKHVPLHLDAFTRSPALREWVEDLTHGLDATFLTPEGWYEDTNKEGVFIWSPPPAAADVVVERLGIARHKRPNSLHLVFVPRLMTGRWRRHLGRGTDCYFRINTPPLWDLKSQCEPVLLYVSLPFLPHRPEFQWRGDIIKQLRWVLQEMQDSPSSFQRDLLRQLFLHSRCLPPVQRNVVC